MFFVFKRGSRFRAILFVEKICGYHNDNVIWSTQYHYGVQNSITIRNHFIYKKPTDWKLICGLIEVHDERIYLEMINDVMNYYMKNVFYVLLLDGQIYQLSQFFVNKYYDSLLWVEIIYRLQNKKGYFYVFTFCFL